MGTTRRIFTLLALALAGVLLAASPASAWWLHHGGVVYKQRVVYRGGFSPGLVAGGGVVGGAEFAPLGFTTLGSGVELAPLVTGFESFRIVGTGGSNLQDMVRNEVTRQRQEAAQQEKSSASSAGTATGGGASTTACSGLSTKLTDIDGRLTKLEAKLKEIETKVDQLVADKVAQQQQQQQQQLIKLIAAAVDEANKQTRADRKQDNANMAVLFRELLKEPAKRDQATIDRLLKSLEGQ
jgi:hypothetical protein